MHRKYTMTLWENSTIRIKQFPSLFISLMSLKPSGKWKVSTMNSMSEHFARAKVGTVLVGKAIPFLLKPRTISLLSKLSMKKSSMSSWNSPKITSITWRVWTNPIMKHYWPKCSEFIKSVQKIKYTNVLLCRISFLDFRISRRCMI